MIDHNELRQLISTYFDGQANAQEAKLVEEHLQQCADCQRYAQVLGKLSSSLKTWPDETLSPDLEQKIKLNLQKVQKSEGQKMNKNPLITVGVGGGWLVVIVLSVFVMQTYSQRAIQARVRDASSYLTKEAASVRPAVPVVAELASKAIDAVTLGYVSRGIQGRLKSATDDLGDQYNPGSTQRKTELVLGQTAQYEPYYASSNYQAANVDKETRRVEQKLAAAAPVETGSMRASASFQKSTYAGAGAASEYLRQDQSDEVTQEYARYVVPASRPQWNTEQYESVAESDFLDARQDPLSTFAIDVDTASYSNIRRFLTNGQMPPADAVRIEEMLNYFSYDYPQAWGLHPISIATEGMVCPWNNAHRLVMVGLKAKELNVFQKQPPSNLVFLIDVSGSMNSGDKLPLLKSALYSMVQQLRNEDRVAIVTYADGARLVLNSTLGYNKAQITNAINSLQAQGSTNGGDGIRVAYQIAHENFLTNGNNRIVLATDGDFNVGVTSDAELVNLIEQEKQGGVFLTVLGLGTGNYKDAKMEKLADKGNGNYFYIDSLEEGEKVLTKELGSTLLTVAKDVKVQVEFNPAYVQEYRLIGYENRGLSKRDFKDDSKDGGEMGAGHTVTALYEIVPANSREEIVDADVDPLKYQKTSGRSSGDLLTVKVRYKQPDSDTSTMLSKTIGHREVNRRKGSDNIQFASAVAEFGMLLNNSQHKGNSSYPQVLNLARTAQGADSQGYRAEFIRLVEQAAGLDHRVLNISNEYWEGNTEDVPAGREPRQYQSK